jgi:hypothetical protein
LQPPPKFPPAKEDKDFKKSGSLGHFLAFVFWSAQLIASGNFLTFLITFLIKATDLYTFLSQHTSKITHPRNSRRQRKMMKKTIITGSFIIHHLVSIGIYDFKHIVSIQDFI